MMTDNNKKKADSGVVELEGHKFTFGVSGQEQIYITTRRAIAGYAGRTYRKEFYRMIEEGEEPKVRIPEKPTTEEDKAMYQYRLRSAAADEDALYKEKGKVFLLIMEQCMPALRNKVERLPEYATLEANNNVVGLLDKIKATVYQSAAHQYEFWQMQAQVRKFVAVEQLSRESLDGYRRRFEAQQKELERLWGQLIPNNMKGKKTEDQEAARNKFLACLFLGGTDRGRYKNTMDDLHNDFVSGKGDNVSYPDNV